MAGRDDLLDRAVTFAATHGISGCSLREIAGAIGTSHRMLIYHFGSREGLLVAIVQAVEARTRELAARSGRDLVQGWAHVADPEQHPFERLFFELYGQALQGREPMASMLPAAVEDWLPRRGTERDEARLVLAVVRGLLLDLLATGDRKGTDRAMALFAERYGAGPAQDHDHDGGGP